MISETVQSSSGTVRSNDEGKLRYDLVFPPDPNDSIFLGWVRHMTAHIKDRGDGNWKNASTEEDYQRFRQSAFRHFMQWWFHLEDEDHVSSLLFNLQGAEYVKRKLRTDAFLEGETWSQ